VNAAVRKARKTKQWVKGSYFSYANYPLKICHVYKYNLFFVQEADITMVSNDTTCLQLNNDYEAVIQTKASTKLETPRKTTPMFC
jgi:hypothetical protein